VKTTSIEAEPAPQVSPSRSVERNLPVPQPTSSAVEAAAIEDPEQARRRTIAERMAKLGGIKFGMPGMPLPRKQTSTSQDEPTEPQPRGDAPSQQEYDEETEEAASARRAAIAARLAGQGGQRLGMAPPVPPPTSTLPALPPGRRPSVEPPVHTYPPPSPVSQQRAVGVEDFELESASETHSQSDGGPGGAQEA
jgi:myosin tail region-interacting protein MTI1